MSVRVFVLIPILQSLLCFLSFKEDFQFLSSVTSSANKQTRQVPRDSVSAAVLQLASGKSPAQGELEDPFNRSYVHSSSPTLHPVRSLWRPTSTTAEAASVTTATLSELNCWFASCLQLPPTDGMRQKPT